MDIPFASITKNNKDVTAAAYLRVSLARQSKEGHSLDAQMEKIKAFIQENTLELPSNLIFKDEKPATKVEGREIDEVSIIDSFSERPALTELLKKAQQKAFRHLIIYSRDRLSRVVEDTFALELFFKSCNIKVHYIRDGENFDETKSEISRLLHIVFASLAEMEGNLLSSRVKDGGKACIAKGRWAGGRIPFGYTPAYHKSQSSNRKKWYTTLEKSEFESKFIEEIFNLYLSGMGYRKIAQVMNQKYGFIAWSKSKIEAIIKNETYTGQIAWDRRGGRRNPKRRNCDPMLSPLEPQNIMIDKECWNEIIRERQQRSKNKDAHYYDTPFILKDKIECTKCGRLMKPRNPGTKKRNVYRCANTAEERKICNIIIPSELVEKEFTKHMSKNIFNIKNTDIFWREYDKEFDKRVSDYLEMINEINQKIQKYKELLQKIQEHIDNEKDEYLIEALHTQHVIYHGLIEKYKEALILLKQKKNVTKKTREELDEIVQKFIPGLFIEEDFEELTRIRREFVIRFVHKVVVAYEKDEKKVSINQIEFTPPEFIESL
ncbi:MAG: recombinase family protein [Marinisporobacter sp.]|nr:recombinase family protein [Marinisporobacter sp.]